MAIILTTNDEIIKQHNFSIQSRQETTHHFKKTTKIIKPEKL